MKFSLPLLLLWREVTIGTGNAHYHSSSGGSGGFSGGSSTDGLSRLRMAVYALVFSDHIARTLRDYVLVPSGVMQLLPSWLISTMHLKQSQDSGGGGGGGGRGMSQMSPSLQRFLLSIGPGRV